MREPWKEFELAWEQLREAISEHTTIKEAAELLYMRGYMDGKTAGMRPLLSPEEEVKLAAATKGERFNHEHYSNVVRAMKHIS